MDRTKEFILQCEKAEEIQEGDYENGDLLFYRGKWGMYFKEYFYEEIVFNDGKMIDYAYDTIWLPRQDQLQEMVKFDCIVERVRAFYGFVFGYRRTYTNDFNSMEQLWLAFVMKELYNKIWNGEEWKVKNVYN